MSFSYLALTLVLLSATPSAAFSGPTAILPRHSMVNRAAVSLRRPALHTLKCQESGQATAEDTASYEIIPSALAEQGGGWSIKGLKAVSAMCPQLFNRMIIVDAMRLSEFLVVLPGSFRPNLLRLFASSLSRFTATTLCPPPSCSRTLQKICAVRTGRRFIQQ